MGVAAVVEHALGDSGLAGVDMGDDAEVAELVDIMWHGGGNTFATKELMIGCRAAWVNGAHRLVLPMAVQGSCVWVN